MVDPSMSGCGVSGTTLVAGLGVNSSIILPLGVEVVLPFMRGVRKGSPSPWNIQLAAILDADDSISLASHICIGVRSCRPAWPGKGICGLNICGLNIWGSKRNPGICGPSPNLVSSLFDSILSKG